MQRTVEAVYEDGVLKPLEDLDLPEHQRVQITVELPTPADGDANRALRAWQAVYEDLTPDDIAEIEAIALDRSRFMKRPK